ncbi:MAG: hypothetical protein M1838_002199 [Thelocarpon superellum]|nr:MAG: hypothetical protein M1838_002199 [Thelocarpon superellum]
MCRWFAYVSESEECLLDDVLVRPAHSLSKQVHDHYLPKLLSHSLDPSQDTTAQEITVRNRLFNIDGLGVAWYTDAAEEFGAVSGQRPALYKTIQAPLNDLNFRSICANTRSKVCFAHIRAATSTATTPVNNHPFVFGRHTLMHNGYISDFVEIKRELCLLLNDDVAASIRGSTDSEHFAALYMTHLTQGKGSASWEEQYTTAQMHTALEHTVASIVELQHEKLGARAQPSDLNVATTDGSRLVAIRFRNHEHTQPPSLYFSTTAGVTLNRKYPDHPDGKANPSPARAAKDHGSHIIVASEPSTYHDKDWTLIEKNQSVLVETDGGVRLSQIDYPRDYAVRPKE